jgi:predicted RNase H-like nuclease
MTYDRLSDIPFSRIVDKDGRDVTAERMPLSVLGIDAAWDLKNPSGVALIHKMPGEGWEFLALSPSYDAFIGLAARNQVQWDRTPKGGMLEPELLLESAKKLLGGLWPSVISVDMPMSTGQITGRRKADNGISTKFGAKGCSTHSPNPRLGKFSNRTRELFEGFGYKLAVSETDSFTIHSRKVIESYPHPALLCLLELQYRFPYKVGKSLKYFPSTSVEDRGQRLLAKFRAIKEGLNGEIQGIPDFLPSSFSGPLNSLKRYEDALDALICAWVGARYLSGNATPYGDDKGVIWVPDSRSSPLSS